jgi:inosine triphosphate pyrophosphatase
MHSEPNANELNNFRKFQQVTFVSSNSFKIREVEMILGNNFPWKLNSYSVELTEPQATAIEVSISKCKQAANLCNGPVIVEDTSLCFNALNGLPGPYIKWFYESIGNVGLTKLLDGHDDKSGYAQCVLSFSLGPEQAIKTFVGSTDGIIVYPCGPAGFGWDQIFQVIMYNFCY